MSNKLLGALFSLGMLLVSNATLSQSFDQSSLALLSDMNKQPNVLARYDYLIKITPSLSPEGQILAGQFRSFSESELGLYGQAIFSFPLKGRSPSEVRIPETSEWKSVDAVNEILKLAADRHIVLINEAHHDAHTRELTLSLLPRLRKLGFNYFAAEALTNTDTGLMHRGYPIKDSGTEYLQEPLYGEIVREAIRLGFTVVSYDSSDSDPQERENQEADNLYQKVFSKDPNARLFVHAGYAHIDKKSGRLGSVRPMAMHLQTLTGFDALSIDQTEFLETGWDKSDAYHELTQNFPTKGAEVLINRKTGEPWSARPGTYDLNVILPKALQIQVFGVDRLYGDRLGNNAVVMKDLTRISFGIKANDMMHRQNWLDLEGLRQAFPIDTGLCESQIPCVIAAHYTNEPNDSPAADRYAFMKPQSASNLYLRPGRYRLHIWGLRGQTISDQEIEVSIKH